LKENKEDGKAEKKITQIFCGTTCSGCILDGRPYFWGKLNGKVIKSPK
jgi:hypothetical protein